MKSIREFETMELQEQESFIAHAGARLVQKMYYDNNSKGLEIFVKNLGIVISRATDCMECLSILNREGDVYAKIYLLLEYMGKGGISEEFVQGLEEITERAQEALAQSAGVIPTAGEEEREILKRLGSVMDRHAIKAAREINSAGSNTAPKESERPQTMTAAQKPQVHSASEQKPQAQVQQIQQRPQENQQKSAMLGQTA